MGWYTFGMPDLDDGYIYAVDLESGEPMIARRDEGEFKTLAQIKDEIARRTARNDQVLAEWAAAVDRDHET